MISEFLQMGGYGAYVWTAFLTVLISCFLLFYRTRKTLKKYEKEFAKELEQLTESEKNLVLKKSKVANQILASYNKSI